MAEQTPAPRVEVAGAAPVTRLAKSRKKSLIIGATVLVGLCLCAVLCTVPSDLNPFRLTAQQGDIENVIDAFMRAMANKDADQAHALFSGRAQTQTPRSALERMLKTNDFVSFYGYKKVEVASLYIGPAINTNPSAPQGTVARVSGRLFYEGGYTGNFQATLEKENNEWKLYSIKVTIPPRRSTIT